MEINKKRQAVLDTKDKRGDFFPINIPSNLLLELQQNGRDSIIKLENVSDGYFFHGPTGSGKSYQAACIMTDLAKERVTRGIWVNVPELLHKLKMSFRKNDSEDLIGRYSETNLLCLDDLGIDSGSRWVMETLYLIINKRYEEMRTTIITSNLSLSELANQMNDNRLISRISSMCNVIKLEGRDRRKRVRKI